MNYLHGMPLQIIYHHADFWAGIGISSTHLPFTDNSLSLKANCYSMWNKKRTKNPYILVWVFFCQNKGSTRNKCERLVRTTGILNYLPHHEAQQIPSTTI